MMQYVHGKLNPGLSWQKSSFQQDEGSFHKQIGLKYKEETSKMLLSEHSFVWFCTLGIWQCRSEIPGQFGNSVLENGGEDLSNFKPELICIVPTHHSFLFQSYSMTAILPNFCTFFTCRSICLSWQYFKLLKPTGYVMHHQFNIQQLYALPTLYLCVLYLSENKQRLVPLTA